jgi:hypothetical protein
MMPPIENLTMVKYMHDELHEKRAASRERELAAKCSEHRFSRLFRTVLRRNTRQIATHPTRCPGLGGGIDRPELSS